MLPFTVPATPPNIRSTLTRLSFGIAARNGAWFSLGILTQAIGAHCIVAPMLKRAAPLLLFSFLLALTACPKSGPESGPGPGPGSNPPVDPLPATPADAAPTAPPAQQHETCSDTIACATGLTCVKFKGIAGNDLASCEIPCDRKNPVCPTGQKCSTVADGPGDVCVTDPGGTTGGGSTGGGGGSTGGSGSTGGGGSTSALPKQTEACPDNRCSAGLTCVSYYGIAGKRGPKFTSCEIPCSGGATCPKGQNCSTIADGPGQVCRP
jgi:uncharacterized membrane protein YgcG